MRWWLWSFAIACGSPPVQPREPAPVVIADAVVLDAPGLEARRDYTVELAPMSIVATAGRVFYTDMAGAVWRLPLDGGAATQLSDQKHPDFAFSLFLAGDAVLATARHGVLRIDDTVEALAITGLPDQPEEVVADAAYMYLTVFKHTGVMRVPVTGGKAERLADIPRGVLALRGSTLYIASYSTGVLYTLPTTGGTPRAIVRDLPRPTAVVADATHAFVYCERDESLRRIDLATGAMTTIATGLVNSDDLALDGDWIYTRSWGKHHALIRIAKTGGTPEVVTDDVKSPYRIAIDIDAIYVTSRDDRRIIRLPKR